MKKLLLFTLFLSSLVACGPYVVEHTGEVTVKVTLEELATYFEVKCSVANATPEEISNCVANSIKEFADIVGVKQ